MRMLKKEVLRDLLEEEYAAGRQEFLDFSETCAPGKNDARIEDLLQRTAEFAESYPGRKSGWRAVWKITGRKQRKTWNRRLLSGFWRRTRPGVLRDLKETARQLLEDAEGPGGRRNIFPCWKRIWSFCRNWNRSGLTGSIMKPFRSCLSRLFPGKRRTAIGGEGADQEPAGQS